jgi:hypothetical protein
MASYGPIWPQAPALQGLFTIIFVAGFGLVRSRDCGSHGRGPRFDPLCAHHASPFGLRMALPAKKSRAKHVRRSLSAAKAKTDEWKRAFGCASYSWASQFRCQPGNPGPNSRMALAMLNASVPS